MSNLYFLVGPPRSGKSTLTKYWMQGEQDPEKRLPSNLHRIPNRVFVRADDIRLSFGDRYNESVEDYVSAIKHTMIKTLLIGRCNVLVDGTHTSERSISKILDINPKAQAIPLFTPKEICIERAKDSGQTDLIPILDRFYHQINSFVEKYNSNIGGDYEKLEDSFLAAFSRYQQQHKINNKRV